MRPNIHIAAFLALLLAVSQITEGKRSLGRSRGSSKSSSSGGGRRTSSHTSSSGSVTKPTYQGSNSHADLAKLSYSGYNSQPNRPSSSGSGSSVVHKPSAPEVPKTVGSQNNAPPIGWNVPKSDTPAVAVNKPPSYSQANMGPPPAYSPHNTPGGAKTNINEPPPAYKPNQGAPPPYPMNNQPSSGASYPRQPTSGSSYPQQGSAVAAHNTGYRHHGNSTGGFGSGAVHTPIQSHSASPVMGAYPAGGTHGAVPQGATYYPQGQLPPGAVLYPHGSFPQGGAPMGYPAGGYASYPQQQPVFVGSGIQPGVYSAGSLPVQHSSNSGPGFGTGLLAGAVGGAVLGHVLTPTHHVTHTDTAAAGGGSDRVIIINNTPGQAADVTNPAPGVQVINPGQPASAAQPAPAAQPVPAAPATVPEPAPGAPQPGPVAPQPAPVAPQSAPAAPGPSDTMVPLAPFPVGTPENPQQQPGSQPANPPVEGAASTGGDLIPLAPFPPNTANGTVPAEEPKVYCYPVQVNVTDPANPDKITTVEQIACYTMAPQPPQPPQPPQAEQPLPGAAPVQQQPDMMHLPGDSLPPETNVPTQKTSTAQLSASTKIQNGASTTYPATIGIILTAIVAIANFVQ